jgi:capsular polysaccharide biosynthesis protein
MTIRDTIRAIRERWLTVVSVLVIAVLSAGATWYLRPKEFTAPLTLYVSAQPVYTNQTVLQSTQLSPPLPWSTRLTSYVELLTNPRVSEAVIQQLQLSETPEALSKQIVAASATDSIVIDVAVTDRSAERAARIANAVGAAFTNLVDELERPRSPDGVSPIAVRVARAASVPAEPSSLGLPVMLALGFLSGVAVGVGVALARHTFDRSTQVPVPVRDPAGTPAKSAVNPWAVPNQGPGSDPHSSQNTGAGQSIGSTRSEP